MATGFAGFLLFMKATKKEGGKYFGQRDAVDYEIKDDSADYFHEIWRNNDSDHVVDKVLANTELWEADLDKLPGFAVAVKQQLKSMIQNGALETVAELVKQGVTR
jgi:tagaturonate reductase